MRVFRLALRQLTRMAATGFGAPVPLVNSQHVDDIGVMKGGGSVYSFKNDELKDIVELLRGSAPYIELHQKSTVVVHVDSELSESDHAFQGLMDDVATLHVLGVRVVLTMSVRAQVDGRVGPRQGMRVTGDKELRAVQAESGLARSRVEAALAKGLSSSHPHGRARVGVDVVSGNGFYTARPVGVVNGIDMGATGTVRNVEVNKIHRHLDNGEIVLLTALGYSTTGETFNVQTEEVAAKSAKALGASKLVFVSPLDLVFLSSEDQGAYRRVASLRLDDARRLTRRDDLVVLGDDESLRRQTADMCAWSVYALEGGVVRAHFVPPTRGALLRELYTRDGAGTLVASDIYEGIRPATLSDLDRIVQLIEPLEKDGTLLRRPRDSLQSDIANGCFYVLARDQRPIACAMFKRLDDTQSAELGCLVVDKAYRKMAKADAILSYLERLAIANNVTDLFALSTTTMHWFVERGFQEVDFDDLPRDRRLVYDDSRRPKIYRKRLGSDRDVDMEDSVWTTRTTKQPAPSSDSSSLGTTPLP